MTEHLPSDTLATPKTDAVAIHADTHAGRTVRVVPYDFARAQERRIAELEHATDVAIEINNGHVQRIAELEAAVRAFIKGMDEAEQIRELVTKISGNPVNGMSAYIWWCSRYLNVSCFNEAREVLEQKP